MWNLEPADCVPTWLSITRSYTNVFEFLKFTSITQIMYNWLVGFKFPHRPLIYIPDRPLSWEWLTRNSEKNDLKLSSLVLTLIASSNLYHLPFACHEKHLTRNSIDIDFIKKSYTKEDWVIWTLITPYNYWLYRLLVVIKSNKKALT